MASKLDQLKAMTVVVADTGDLDAIRKYKPVDCTTNPSLILKAVQSDSKAIHELVDEAVVWGRSHNKPTSVIADRVVINVGAELTRLVPGRVSTEVNADLSFDTEGTIEKARAIIADYESRGIDRGRILIKIASTWEGIRAAEVLQGDGIDCNMTLLFSLAQAAAAADAGVFLVSPFVGRIFDWYTKSTGEKYTPETDPGVRSVRQIYSYYKGNDIPTIVMGASFRNQGEIEALAGCDRLTISPSLLEALAKDQGKLERKLSPESARGNAPSRMSLDEKSFRYMLNEDAMATDKLADGIRLFAQDLTKLRELVSKRIEASAAVPAELP
ncbi:MAG TPA: transaldolase [Beijerinckiaceae bacterium]|jgi:transaldolase|nr:transaldolase [Beijerinckiaceae bacterium]